MSDFEEAMLELHILDDAEPMVKMEAVCQWILGDPAWAQQFIDWAEKSGMRVLQAPDQAPPTIEYVKGEGS